MNRPLDPSEEYILAAFLSGDLPVHLRREIISYLAGHDRARDLLAMAQEAMEAAEAGDGSTREAPVVTRLPKSGGRKWTPANPVIERNLWKITAFFAGAVLVLTLIVAVLAWNTSRLRDATVTDRWVPVVSGEEVALEWEQIPGASDYHIMYYDSSSGQVAIIGRTGNPRIELVDLEQDTFEESEPVWILAFDRSGQFLDSSDAVRLQRAD